jgi:activating signal cointegrator 1
MNQILTVGYNADWTPDLLAAEMHRLGALLFDIRLNPTSTHAEWRRNALQQRLGVRYTHVGALGNLNYANGGEIRLAAPHMALKLAAAALDLGPIILLCACPNWQTCHRNDAAAFLAEQLGARVEHLEPPVQVAADTLPALTLTAPYGTLIALREKRIETRSWATSYRGRIAIHQGKTLGPVYGLRGLQRLCDRVEFSNILWRNGVRKGNPPNDAWADVLPLGAVIATAELVDCVPTDVLVQAGEIGRFTEEGAPRVWVLTNQERAFGDYGPGRFAWLLDDIRPLAEPIPARGLQGLWRWPVPEGLAL